ncbi:hypothetical protein OHA04_45580 (plasmid) [Streptomyces sp. NBC_01590]|uniref:hypothetical protein n=1 Tax=Streptomyces sp. NBC_01590 TaxID=2975887 RepID=UPI002F915FB5
MSADDFQCGITEATSVELYGPEDGGWFTTRVHDWIALCPFLRDPDVRAYVVLRALVLEKFQNPVRKLTLAVLCELIPGPNGKPSSLTRVRGMLAGLSSVGLISTPEGGPVKTSSRTGAAQRTIRIRINDMPAKGYQGWRNAEAKLKYIKESATEREAGRNSDPGESGDDQGEGAGRNSDPAGSNSDPRGSNSDPDPAPEQQERDLPLVPSFGTATSGDALAARSAGDARRASDRSRRAREEGGCAASGKTSPSPTPNDDACGPASGQKSGSKKAAHTREQLDVVRRVRALFPRELLDAEGGLPDVPTLSSAILTAMGEGRTVEQMGERIWYRWSNHGFADQWAEHGQFEKPVGVAVALVRPLRRGDRFACPDLRCENGASLDTGAPCVRCEERIADWKAEQARKYGPKPSEGANSGSSGTDSPDAPVPPQRAAQPPAEPRSTESWAAQARAEEVAREKGECDGQDGMCGNVLAPGQTLCRNCAKDAAEQRYLENAGTPPPF